MSTDRYNTVGVEFAIIYGGFCGKERRTDHWVRCTSVIFPNQCSVSDYSKATTFLSASVEFHIPVYSHELSLVSFERSLSVSPIELIISEIIKSHLKISSLRNWADPLNTSVDRISQIWGCGCIVRCNVEQRWKVEDYRNSRHRRSCEEEWFRSERHPHVRQTCQSMCQSSERSSLPAQACWRVDDRR